VTRCFDGRGAPQLHQLLPDFAHVQSRPGTTHMGSSCRRSPRDAGDSKLLGLKFTDWVRRQALPLVSGFLTKVAAEKGSPVS
jgi:hypothetical protein